MSDSRKGSFEKVIFCYFLRAFIPSIQHPSLRPKEITCAFHCPLNTLLCSFFCCRGVVYCSMIYINCATSWCKIFLTFFTFFATPFWDTFFDIFLGFFTPFWTLFFHCRELFDCTVIYINSAVCWS